MNDFGQKYFLSENLIFNLTLLVKLPKTIEHFKYLPFIFKKKKKKVKNEVQLKDAENPSWV